MAYAYRRTEDFVPGAVDRGIIQRTTGAYRVTSVLTSPDLLILAGICVTGLLVSLAVTLAVPGFAEVLETFQQLL